VIIVAGTIRLDPAKTAALSAGFTEMNEPSRAESGCIQYEHWLSPDRPDTIFIFERWESSDHLDAHLQTPHVAALRPIMKSSGITAFEMTKYEVADASPLR
jgi:quinol monooxygenase YgiN